MVSLNQHSPKKLTLEVTNQCNLNCIACCHSNTIPKAKASQMTWDIFNKLGSLLPNISEVLLFGLGEPLLNPILPQFITKITGNSRASTKINTNGVLLNDIWRNKLVDSGLDEIIISIDGANEDTLSRLRSGVKLSTILTNLGALCELKTKNNFSISIGIEFVAMRSNIEELPKIILIASDLGVDFIKVNYLIVKSKNMFSESLYFAQQYSDKMLDTAETIGNKTKVRVLLPTKFKDAKKILKATIYCSEPWRNLFVGATGEVYVCCVGGRLYRAGNILIDKLDDVWMAPIYEILRAKFSEGKIIGPCSSCFFHSNASVLLCNTHIRISQEEYRRSLPLFTSPIIILEDDSNA